jgi:hypothetical protein
MLAPTPITSGTKPVSNPLPESPTAAVQAWWQAMQDQDLSALQQLTAEDYLASGGPAGHTTTRERSMLRLDGW